MSLARRLGLLGGDAAYLALGSLFVLYNSIGLRFIHSWGGVDYWEHLAAIEAIARQPWHPASPYVDMRQGSHLFTPYHVVWALLANATSLPAHELAPLMAAANTALFVLGVRAMAGRLTGTHRLALPLALTLLFFWLRPWPWSGFYNFAQLPLTAIYPFWFALSVTLLLLGHLEPRTSGARALMTYALGVSVTFLIHPLTGSFLALALVIRGIAEAGLSNRGRLRRLAAPVAGLALALAWPYFPVLAAIMGAPRFAAQGIAGEWELFYNKFPLRLAPAGLGLVYFAHAVRTRTWDWLGWSLAAVASIYLLNPITAQNSLLSRYVVFLALLLHCGVIRSVSLALGPSAESGSPLGPRMARVVLAAYVLILFGGGALEARDSVRWFGGPQASASVTPAGDRGNRAIIRRFKAFAPFLGPSSVVMAKLEESWVLPAVADARVVGVLHGSPFMRDFEARRDAVTRFFDPGVSASERKEICARYGVTHVLLHRADVGRLPGLGPPATQAVHADDFYELRTLVPPTPPGP